MLSGGTPPKAVLAAADKDSTADLQFEDIFGSPAERAVSVAGRCCGTFVCMGLRGCPGPLASFTHMMHRTDSQQTS